jgi:hypothetical protein
MARLRRHLILSLAIWLAAAGLARAADAGVHGRPDPRAAHQQILVLLRLPPEHFRPNADYSDSYGDASGHSARRRIATRLAHEHGLTLVTDWPLPLVGVDCFVMAIPADRSPNEVAALLSRDPQVAWSEPMNVYHALGGAASHNDPLYPVQPAAREWRLAELHEVATGRNVRVAVIDSMIEKTHPDLLGQVVVSENFVIDQPDAPEQHGTGVAGVIAARADNGIGIAGIAPNARLMALRACWQPAVQPNRGASTICDSLSLAKALHFAITHDAQVINLSLSGPPDPLLGRLLDAALARGVTVVGAFDRGLPDGGFPAMHAGVVAVADEELGAPAANVYLAPGRDVPTTQPGGRWFLVNGSSYAAAQVSGLLALVRERTALKQGSLALVTLRRGGGAIDACATLMRASGPCDCACSHAREYSATVQ